MRKTLRWTWLLVLAAVLYSGSVLFLRWRQNRAAEEDAIQAEAKADREVLDRLGGGELKILMFYANPPSIPRGGEGLLCYGVASAKAVRIEPAVESIAPSLSRCVKVEPKANTIYTLTASDAKGRVETRSVEVTVR